MVLAVEEADGATQKDEQGGELEVGVQDPAGGWWSHERLLPAEAERRIVRRHQHGGTGWETGIVNSRQAFGCTTSRLSGAYDHCMMSIIRRWPVWRTRAELLQVAQAKSPHVRSA